MSIPHPSRHIVILVHGIRTFGSWQERFSAMLHRTDPNVEVIVYKYGYFSTLAFLLPLVRVFPVRRFRRYRSDFAAEWAHARVDIVAHSFGTHIVAWALHGLPDTKVPPLHTILLCGSVLKQLFPWTYHIGKEKRITRIVNDCGTRDMWPLIAQLFVVGMGIAGRRGFAGALGPDVGIVNRYFSVDHSGFFGDDFMQTNWIPLLTSDQLPGGENIVPPSPGWSAALEYYLEPLKLCLLILPIVVIFWIWDAQREEIAKQQGLALVSGANRVLYRDPAQAVLQAHRATELSRDRNLADASAAVREAAADIITKRASIFLEDLKKWGEPGLPNFVAPTWFEGRVKAERSPDGRYLLLTTKRGKSGNQPPGDVYLLDGETMVPRELTPPPEAASRIPRRLEYAGFSRSGDQIYVSRQYNIEVYSNDGSLKAHFTRGSACTKVPIHLVVSGFDQKSVLYADAEGYLRKLDIETGFCVSVYGRHLDPPPVRAFSSSDGHLIACIHKDRSGYILFDSDDAGKYRRIRLPHDNLLTTALVDTEAGTLVFTSSTTDGATIWRIDGNVGDLQRHQALDPGHRAILYAAFSSDGSQLLSVSEDRRITVFDVMSGEALREIVQPSKNTPSTDRAQEYEQPAVSTGKSEVDDSNHKVVDIAEPHVKGVPTVREKNTRARVKTGNATSSQKKKMEGRRLYATSQKPITC